MHPETLLKSYTSQQYCRKHQQDCQNELPSPLSCFRHRKLLSVTINFGARTSGFYWKRGCWSVSTALKKLTGKLLSLTHLFHSFRLSLAPLYTSASLIATCIRFYQHLFVFASPCPRTFASLLLFRLQPYPWTASHSVSRTSPSTVLKMFRTRFLTACLVRPVCSPHSQPAVLQQHDPAPANLQQAAMARRVVRLRLSRCSLAACASRSAEPVFLHMPAHSPPAPRSPSVLVACSRRTLSESSPPSRTSGLERPATHKRRHLQTSARDGFEPCWEDAYSKQPLRGGKDGQSYNLQLACV